MNFSSITRQFALPALALLATLTACSDQDTPFTPAAPDTITISRPALYPESMAFDAASRRFLVGSLTAGTIGEVKDDGTYTPFANDAQLVSTTGILVDAPRNRVLAAVGDLGGNSARTTAATQYQLAALASYDRVVWIAGGEAKAGGIAPAGG